MERRQFSIAELARLPVDPNEVVEGEEDAADGFAGQC